LLFSTKSIHGFKKNALSDFLAGQNGFLSVMPLLRAGIYTHIPDLYRAGQLLVQL
jgi:hypothetical protein